MQHEIAVLFVFEKLSGYLEYARICFEGEDKT